MNPEEVKNIIESLLKTGEILATKAYLLAYKKAIFYGVVDLIVAVLLFVVLFLILKYFKALAWSFKLDEMGHYEFEDKKESLPKDALNFYEKFGDSSIWIAIISFIILPFCLGIGLLLFISGLEWLINPELGAIRILLSFIN